MIPKYFQKDDYEIQCIKDYHYYVCYVDRDDSNATDGSMPKARSRSLTRARQNRGGGGGVPSEPDKSATAPGQARGLSADTSKALEITFKADAPANTGTKKGGAAVKATELKYHLYYAKVGITSNSITISDTTTAADVITAVDTATDATNKDKGRIEATAANLAKGFTLDSLTAPHTYRYTIIVIHPEGKPNSTPATAATSKAVRAENSKATAVDSVPKPTLTLGTDKKDGFTVEWLDADLTTAKQDDGEQLLTGDVSYVVYYTSATTEPTAEAVKTDGSSNTDTSGNVEVNASATKTATASDKAFVHTVYIVVEAINTTDTSKTTLSAITEYAVTGAATTPTAPAVNVTPDTAKLTVQVTPLTTGFGTADNGTPLDASKITYIFYYAKKGEAFDVDGTSTKVEEADVTANHMYAVLKTLDGSTNTANKGKVALTTDAGLGTDKEVLNLTPNTDYHYTVRVEETDTPTNGANTPKAKAATPPPCDKDPTATGWCISTLATGFNSPYGIAVAPDGRTLYVMNIDSVKKIVLPSGTVSTLTTDFKQLTGTVAIAPNGRTLYVGDFTSAGSSIKKIALPSGTVSTIVSKDILIARAITPAPDGNALYVTDAFGGGSSSLKKIALPGGAVSTLATIRIYSFFRGVTIVKDAAYVADSTSNSIRKIALTSPYAMSLIARGFNKPIGIAAAPDGTLYVADTGNHQIKQLTLKADGTLKATTTIAGDGTAGNTNAIGTKAKFKQPRGIVAAKDKDGNTLLYVADTGNNSIRKLEYKE